jgi:hypothetical protein
MPETQARAWWAEVEHLRDGYEQRADRRRQSDRDNLAERRAARTRRREELEAARAATRDAFGDQVPRRRFTRAAAPDGGRHEGPEVRVDLEAVDLEAMAAAPAAKPIRRTVEIRGRTVGAPATTPVRLQDEHEFGRPGDRGVRGERRRPSRPAAERIGARPDRVALWALLMGIVLILVAVGTADAATVASVAGH